MEGLLRIMEAASKVPESEKVNLLVCEAGVYKTTLSKEGGYARDGIGFYNPDDMHPVLVSQGLSPSFPDVEDMPRNERFSFDVYYVVAQNKAHRITLIRAQTPDKSFIRSCFVDGSLIYMCGAGPGPTQAFLFNSEEWNSGATKENLPHFWFNIGELRIDIIADIYFSVNRVFWMHFWNKAPEHYGIFINDKSTLSGSTLLDYHQTQKKEFLPAVLTLVALLPFWVIWQILVSFVYTPVRTYTAKCEVRKYVVQDKQQGFMQAPSEEVIDPKETTRLIVN